MTDEKGKQGVSNQENKGFAGIRGMPLEHGLEFPVSEDVKALGEPIRLQSGKVIPNSMGIHSLEEQPEPLHGQHVRRGLCVASA